MDKKRKPKEHAAIPLERQNYDKNPKHNLKSVNDKIKKYANKDFKNILVKMINEKKCLNEVCKEVGLPHTGAISKYAKKNAEFRKKLETTYKQLPNSVQADDGKVPEKNSKNTPIA